MYEAQFLVEEGATPEQVDRALTEFGMAMGIFAVDDMAGIDVAWRVRQELGHFSDAGGRRPLVADKLYDLGRYGQKRGKGWYRYDESRKATPDPEVIELIRSTAAAAGIPQRTFTDAEIVERCIYALINEGARIVADGSRAGLRHRRHLRERLRVPVVARRPDVLRRPRRPGGDSAAHPGLRAAARAALGAGATAGGARGVRPDVSRARQSPLTSAGGQEWRIFRVIQAPVRSALHEEHEVTKDTKYRVILRALRAFVLFVQREAQS